MFKLVAAFAAFFVVAVNYSECANILGVFPMPGTSHYILCSKLVKGLVKAGHDVTMVSPFVMKDVPKGGKYTDVVLTGLDEHFQSNIMGNNLFEMNSLDVFSMMKRMTNMFLTFSNDTFYHPEVQKLLKSHKKFDAVILEQFSNDALKVFSYIYDCPLIILSSMGASSWVNPMVGNPQPIACSAHLMLGDFSNDLSFLNRAKNLFAYLAEYFLNTFYVFPLHDGIMHQAFPDSPPIYDLYTNVSLVLLNSHTSYYQALPTVPNMVEIGGYFIDPPQKLPADLQKFLDNAKDGVVYFSMGSNLKSKDLPPERKRMILNVLGKLKEKVLWKFEEDLPKKPANVMIRDWLPQQDVLAHPNIKLFITHGGLLSTTESVYHGVPILAIPVFGDQSANADRAVASEYGLKLEYNSPGFSEKILESKIQELLTNPKYRENVQKRSKIYHDRPMSPMETAVYWVGYVVKHKGASHLRVAGVRLPWYKYFMVDVLGAIFLALLTVFVSVRWVLRKLYCKFCGGKTSSKKMTKQKRN